MPRFSSSCFSSLCFSFSSLKMPRRSWFRTCIGIPRPPRGDGSGGGACGARSLVDIRPLNARVGTASLVLFRNGEGCGACYKVRCVDPHICSWVIITNECQGGYCTFSRTTFVLGGAAFSRMAIGGEGAQLHNRG